MRASRATRRSLDIALLVVLAGGFTLFWLHGGEAVLSAWDWPALARAFFRMEPGQGLVSGPLGKGLLNTLRICLWATLLAGLVGLGLGIARASPVRIQRMLGGSLVAVTRNLPPLVLVFIIHYFFSGALAASLDWSWTGKLFFAGALFPEPGRMPAFVSAVVTLGIYEGAYVGEIVRAGIASVPREQWEAAASLGFRRRHTLRLIILPQAFRFMTPPLANQAASLIKDSSIVSVISIQELTFQSLEYMTSSGLIGEIWLSVTACYLVLCLLTSFAGRILEKKFAYGQRPEEAAGKRRV